MSREILRVVSVLAVSLSSLGCQEYFEAHRREAEQQLVSQHLAQQQSVADEAGRTGAPDGIDRVVDVACGQCQLGLSGNGCNLAVRIDDQVLFVDGTGIDDHGDAHAENGFCNAIRKAHVRGYIENDRFVVQGFELLPTSHDN